MNRSGICAQTALLVVVLVLLPFILALLFNAGAEAFFGDTEPIFQTGLGLFIGIMGAGCLAVGMRAINRKGFGRAAWAILIALLVLELSAIPFSWWLIHTANAPPTKVIEL